LGVLILFILPEIIGFIWGKEIASWAHTHYLTSPSEIARLNYYILEEIFKDGGSWLNLSIGLALLIWAILDRD